MKGNYIMNYPATEFFKTYKEFEKYCIKRYPSNYQDVLNDHNFYTITNNEVVRFAQTAADKVYLSKEDFDDLYGPCFDDPAIQHRYEIWSTVNQ
jgi:hypothetical protein